MLVWMFPVGSVAVDYLKLKSEYIYIFIRGELAINWVSFSIQGSGVVVLAPPVSH